MDDAALLAAAVTAAGDAAVAVAVGMWGAGSTPKDEATDWQLATHRMHSARRCRGNVMLLLLLSVVWFSLL